MLNTGYYTDESLAVYMSAFHVLHYVADEGATSMLQLALDYLHKRADSLNDKVIEKLFWAAPLHLAVTQVAAKHLPGV